MDHRCHGLWLRYGRDERATYFPGSMTPISPAAGSGALSCKGYQGKSNFSFRISGCPNLSAIASTVYGMHRNGIHTNVILLS
jgi:hypothetical protein